MSNVLGRDGEPVSIEEALSQLEGKFTPIEEHEIPYGPPGPDDVAPWIESDNEDD